LAEQNPSSKESFVNRKPLFALFAAVVLPMASFADSPPVPATAPATTPAPEAAAPAAATAPAAPVAEPTKPAPKNEMAAMEQKHRADMKALQEELKAAKGDTAKKTELKAKMAQLKKDQKAEKAEFKARKKAEFEERQAAKKAEMAAKREQRKQEQAAKKAAKKNNKK